MNKKDKPKYEFLKDLTTGKIKKQKIDYEEWGEDYIPPKFDEAPKSDYRKHIVRTLPCPYQLDKPEVYTELMKPLKMAKFTCEVDVEILLETTLQDNHDHEIFLDVDKTNFPLGADLSEYEFDLGTLACGFSYEVTPKIQVTLTKKEFVENGEVEKGIKRVENDAQASVGKEEIESGRIQLKNHQKIFKQMKEYFEKHLAEELGRVTERIGLEHYILDERGEEREANIKLLVSEEDIELRKRLQTAKGRVPTKLQKSFGTERKEFINTCFNALRQLEKERKKLLKSKMAEIVFSDLNPQQSLRRKLNVLDLTFEEILHKYNEHKSS